jgi:hypothetical protein
MPVPANSCQRLFVTRCDSTGLVADYTTIAVKFLPAYPRAFCRSHATQPAHAEPRLAGLPPLFQADFVRRFV